MVATPIEPSSLVYEILNDRAIYYREYQNVLAGHIDRSAITGNSGIKSLLASLLTGYLYQTLTPKKYLVITNEPELSIPPGTLLVSDIMVFDRSLIHQLTDEPFTAKPALIILIDIKADLTDCFEDDLAYVAEKTQRLFDFGVERVLWVLSRSRRVFVAVPNQDWIFTEWSNDIPVLEGCILNVKRLLDEEGIAY